MSNYDSTYQENKGTRKCPYCSYPQYCGCGTCRDKDLLPCDIIPIEQYHEDDILVFECSNCGFAESDQWWWAYKEGWEITDG